MTKRGMINVATLVLVWAVASWWGGSRLAQPPRRLLQDYHREFLNDPAAHGVSLKAYSTADGTPCLCVEPLSDGRLGDRGKLVRTQLTEQGAKLPPEGSVRGNVVLLHGRKGRKEDYLFIAERFCATGFRCLLVDLPGHGDNPNPNACYGMRETELASVILDEASAQFHFKAAPCGLMGLSMGGAVAIQTAAKHPERWSALVVVSSFDTLQNTVHHQTAAYVGAVLASVLETGSSWVYEWRTGIPLASIRSIDAVPKLTMPTLVAHGSDDHVVPGSCGKALFAALPAGLEKRWVEIPGADHDNVLITRYPVYATICSWMLDHVK